MQARTFEFREDDKTWLLNNQYLHVIPYGRYFGFAPQLFTNSLNLVLEHSLTNERLTTGIQFVDYDTNSGNLTEPRGVVVSRQGVVIYEVDPITIQVPSNASSGLPRKDLVVMEHEYLTSDGGAQANYLIIPGIPSPNPQAPNPQTNFQVPLGILDVPAGAGDLQQATYTIAPIPSFASALPDTVAFTDKVQQWTEYQLFQQLGLYSPSYLPVSSFAVSGGTVSGVTDIPKEANQVVITDNQTGGNALDVLIKPEVRTGELLFVQSQIYDLPVNIYKRGQLGNPDYCIYSDASNATYAGGNYHANRLQQTTGEGHNNFGPGSTLILQYFENQNGISKGWRLISYINGLSGSLYGNNYWRGQQKFQSGVEEKEVTASNSIILVESGSDYTQNGVLYRRIGLVIKDVSGNSYYISGNNNSLVTDPPPQTPAVLEIDRVAYDLPPEQDEPQNGWEFTAHLNHSSANDSGFHPDWTIVIRDLGTGPPILGGTYALSGDRWRRLRLGDENVTDSRKLRVPITAGTTVHFRKQAGMLVLPGMGAIIEAFRRMPPVGSMLYYHGNPNDLERHWAICDGTNGTPDARNRFILAAGIPGSPVPQGELPDNQGTWIGPNEKGGDRFIRRQYLPETSPWAINDPGHSHSLLLEDGTTGAVDEGNNMPARQVNADASYYDQSTTGSPSDVRVIKVSTTDITLETNSSFDIFGNPPNLNYFYPAYISAWLIKRVS